MENQNPYLKTLSDALESTVRKSIEHIGEHLEHQQAAQIEHQARLLDSTAKQSSLRILTLESALESRGIPIPSTSTPEKGDIRRALEAAAIMVLVPNVPDYVIQQGNYLRRNEWKLRDGGLWTDPVSGGSLMLNAAVALQTNRAIKPFAYLLR